MSKQPLLKPKPQLNNFDIDEIVLQDCLDKHNPKLGKTLGLVLDQKARTAKKLWLFPNGKKFIVAGSKALGMDAGELTMDDLEMFASENVIGNVRETYKKIDNFQKRFSGADGKQLLRRMLDAVYDRSFSEAIDLKKLIDTGQFSEDSLLAFLTDFDNAAYFAVNQPEVLDQIIKSIDSAEALEIQRQEKLVGLREADDQHEESLAWLEKERLSKIADKQLEKNSSRDSFERKKLETEKKIGEADLEGKKQKKIKDVSDNFDVATEVVRQTNYKVLEGLELEIEGLGEVESLPELIKAGGQFVGSAGRAALNWFESRFSPTVDVSVASLPVDPLNPGVPDNFHDLKNVLQLQRQDWKNLWKQTIIKGKIVVVKMKAEKEISSLQLEKGDAVADIKHRYEDIVSDLEESLRQAERQQGVAEKQIDQEIKELEEEFVTRKKIIEKDFAGHEKAEKRKTSADDYSAKLKFASALVTIKKMAGAEAIVSGRGLESRVRVDSFSETKEKVKKWEASVFESEEGPSLPLALRNINRLWNEFKKFIEGWEETGSDEVKRARNLMMTMKVTRTIDDTKSWSLIKRAFVENLSEKIVAEATGSISGHGWSAIAKASMIERVKARITQSPEFKKLN